eukprot:TRINITY_DN17072_c0_g2_i1.p1 TRINITY_DN17072_c0_g2~~TRINITY_DN17072_c0_g2_i1.p1  ORF type:complete len:226 (-),score=48.71 TRINITY_DN17072_c0_g2_i1:348-1025(-)
MGVTIALQGKVVQSHDGKLERWVEKIGVSDKGYKMQVDPPAGSKDNSFHNEHKSMNVMKVLNRGKKVAIVKKQRFAGALGNLEQPFIGVQIEPSAGLPENPEDNTMRTLLDTRGLMLLLLSLTWCEDSLSPPTSTFSRFLKAMRHESGSSGSAATLGLSDTWDISDVQNRLKHIPYAEVHDWVASRDGIVLATRDHTAASSSSSGESEDEDVKDVHAVAGDPERV